MTEDDRVVLLGSVHANRALIIMLASLLVGAGSCSLEDMQDSILAGTAAPDVDDPAVLAEAQSQIRDLAALFDASVLGTPRPGRPTSRPPTA